MSTSQPTIAGTPVDLWEGYLDDVSEGTDAATGFRGMRCEPDSRGVSMVYRAWMPAQPWLGINSDGTRVTIAQHRARKGMA